MLIPSLFSAVLGNAGKFMLCRMVREGPWRSVRGFDVSWNPHGSSMVQTTHPREDKDPPRGSENLDLMTLSECKSYKIIEGPELFNLCGWDCSSGPRRKESRAGAKRFSFCWDMLHQFLFWAGSFLPDNENKGLELCLDPPRLMRWCLMCLPRGQPDLGPALNHLF